MELNKKKLHQTQLVGTEGRLGRSP